MTKCGNMENAGMAVDILGRTSKDDDSDVEAYTTFEIKTGGCLVSMMEEGGTRQMGDDLWLLDTGATGHFTHDPRLLENYAECSRVLRCVGCNTFPIVGTGTLRLSLRSVEGVVCVTLVIVAHVPGLSHHLLSLRRTANAGNKYIGTREGIQIVFAKSGDELFAPSCGQLNGIFGYRTDRSSEENVHAVIAPGTRPTPSATADINEFHCSHGHMHEDLLRKTAKQIGVKLQGQLVPCQGCTEAKAIKKPVKPFTYTRATKPAERCFVDLSGPTSVKSMWGKEYMMIVIDYYSRFTRVFFLRTKDETATYFSKYLAEIAPRKVEVVRSDGGGEFSKGAFGALCIAEKVRHEFTTADSPQYNGVAERQIAIIEAADLAARIQATSKYPNEVFPCGESLWAEQAHWACHALNCTATSAKPGYKSPHEMWFGSPPSSSPFPFLKPGFRSVKRRNKLQPKAVRCWYLGPAPNYHRDSMRITCKSGRAVATRHVTWAHVPTPIPSTPQQAIFAPREISSDGDESEEDKAPSAAVKSRLTSSEDDGSGGECHSGGDSTDDVFLYDGVGVGDGLGDLDGTPQKTDERRQRYQRRLRAFNTKRTNRQGSVVKTNSGRISNAPSRDGEGNATSSSIGGGGDVTFLSPFWEGTAQNQPRPRTDLTTPLVKCDEFGASLPTM